MTLEEMLGGLIADHREKIVERAIEKLSSRLAKSCLADAEARATKVFDAKVDAIVAEYAKDLAAVQFFETDSYGNRRTGDPKTIVELILDRSEKWLSEKVDKDGRSGYYGSDKDRSRAQWLASKAAEELVKTQLQPEIDKAKLSLKAQFDGKLSAAFQEAVKNCLKP